MLSKLKRMLGIGQDIESNDPHYRVARVSKLNDHWTPEHTHGDSAVSESWDMATRRIRDLVDNDPVFQKIDSQLTALVIGNGLHPFASAETSPGVEDEDFNDESDIWFDRWAEEECHSEREHSLWELQRLSFSDMTKVGANLWIEEISNENKICPLSYKLVEWEQFAWDYNTPIGLPVQGLREGHRIINGIEFDSKHRKVAYWFYFDHPFDTQSIELSDLQPVRIPANKVIHNYLPTRISNRTGISWYAALAMVAKDRDRVIGNTLTSLGISALMTLLIKSKGSQSKSVGLDTKDPDTGISRMKMGYPAKAHVGPEDSVEVIESKKGIFELKSFIELIQVLESQAGRLSTSRTTGDTSKSNMASIRAGHLDDESMVEPIRQHQGKRVARRIRRRFNEIMVAKGGFRSITARHFTANWHAYQTVDVVGGKQADISPEEWVTSSIKALRSGLSNFKTECARRGKNWRREIREIKQVNEYAERHGVVLDWGEGQGGRATKTTTIAGPEEEPAGETNGGQED